MSWFANVKIGAKFNIIMSFLLVSLLLVAAYLTYHRQQSLLLKIAVDNARNYAKVIIETRDYISSVVRGEPENNYGLVPQVVATQVAKRLTKDHGTTSVRFPSGTATPTTAPTTMSRPS